MSGGGLVPASARAAGISLQSVDDKLIDDHLAVQAIIRSYQVFYLNFNINNSSVLPLKFYLNLQG